LGNTVNSRAQASPLTALENRPLIQHRLSGSTTSNTGSLTSISSATLCSYWLLHQLVWHLQQRPGLLTRCWRASAQAGQAHHGAGNQDCKQFLAIPQRHATRLADPGQFRLLIGIDQHRSGQPSFQLGRPLLQRAPAWPQLVELLLPLAQELLDPVGFTVEPWPADTALLGIAADVAVLAMKDKKRMGDPWLGS
jgi:hypothetical protein